MERLTESDSKGNWWLKGLDWFSVMAGVRITEEVKQNLYKALHKLKDYEDSGLSPEEVQAMIELYDRVPPKRMPDAVADHIMERFTKQV